jgi:KUP system potassium uptake protein
MKEIMQHVDILTALNPYYAYDLLANYPNGFGCSCFPCTTGAEALYSDLGHCGIKNIRITWVYVKISLVVAYLGQAAWLMHQETLLHGRNPFESIPTWFYP